MELYQLSCIYIFPEYFMPCTKYPIFTCELLSLAPRLRHRRLHRAQQICWIVPSTEARRRWKRLFWRGLVTSSRRRIASASALASSVSAIRCACCRWRSPKREPEGRDRDRWRSRGRGGRAGIGCRAIGSGAAVNAQHRLRAVERAVQAAASDAMSVDGIAATKREPATPHA